MPCTKIGNMIVCTNRRYKLRLTDGRNVFMVWHDYLGPTFYHDRHFTRMIDDWWKDFRLCRALEWFLGRGKRA
jgi:hypothetical protein